MEKIEEGENDKPIAEKEALQAGQSSKHRLMGLADGIFAFAMTVLVIDVKVDRGIGLSWNIFPALIGRVEGCLLSFLVLGAYWIAHHNLFQHIKATDRIFLWINILFLTCIAFIPFGADLIGSHNKQQISVFIYGGIIVLASLSTELMYWYAFHDNKLVSPNINEEVPKVAMRRVFFPIVVYVAAIGVSFLSIPISIGIFVAVPAFFIFPARTDWHWRKFPHGKKEN